MKHIIIDKGKYHAICSDLLGSSIKFNFLDLDVIKNIKAGCEIPGTQLVVEDYEMAILLHCFKLHRRKHENRNTND